MQEGELGAADEAVRLLEFGRSQLEIRVQQAARCEAQLVPHALSPMVLNSPTGYCRSSDILLFEATQAIVVTLSSPVLPVSFLLTASVSAVQGT